MVTHFIGQTPEKGRSRISVVKGERTGPEPELRTSGRRIHSVALESLPRDIPFYGFEK
jgi:hypothetical protein